MVSAALVRLGGLTAMVGGLLWVLKGGSILITGQQPPVAFEAAMPLFAVGLLRLHARLEGRGGPLGKAGPSKTWHTADFTVYERPRRSAPRLANPRIVVLVAASVVLVYLAE
jgi:hypothetical protein